MAEMQEATRPAVAHHIFEGATTFPYAVDAQHAVGRHPLEWSFEPWTGERRSSALNELSARRDREIEIANARGLTPPPPLASEMAQPILTLDEQAALYEHSEAVAAANDRLQARREKLAAEKAEADQIAADEALVKSAPPMPDPSRPKRPFGRTGEPTPAELEQIKKREAKKADDERLVREKAQADAQAGGRSASETQIG